MSFHNYSANYYSIDDIMVTQQRIECDVPPILRKLDCFESTVSNHPTESDNKMELPLWCVTQTDSGTTNKVHIPDIYKQVYKDAYKADPTAVQLGKLNRYFYEYGRYIVRHDPLDMVSQMLFDTSQERMKYLMDLCQNTERDFKFDGFLDHQELELVQIGSKKIVAFNEWLKKNSETIQMDDLVSTYKKRKRAAVMETEEDESFRKRKTV